MDPRRAARFLKSPVRKTPVGIVAVGPSRDWACRACGALRRSAAFARAPRCHSADMTPLTYEQGEAASRLTRGARPAWMASGMHVVRATGRKKWRAATGERAVARSLEQVAQFERRTRAKETDR